MEQREFELVTNIAARKAEFYVKAKRNLLAALPPAVDHKEARLRLRQAISNLDNMLFVGEQEKASGTINPALSISELSLDASGIVEQVVNALTTT